MMEMLKNTGKGRAGAMGEAGTADSKDLVNCHKIKIVLMPLGSTYKSPLSSSQLSSRQS